MINNGKAKIDQTFTTLSISIPSKKNWFALIFGTAWMGGWFAGFLAASSTLFKGGMGNGMGNNFLVFWLIMWTIGGIAITTTLLWGYFGKEDFILNEGEVQLNKTVFGIGIKKKFEAIEIKNIRAEADNSYSRNRWAVWGMGPGKIKFDYGLKTYSFGMAVDDAEANHIVEIMQKQF